MPQQKLGLMLGWQRARLSRQLSRMADRGLLTREDGPAGRRVIVATDSRPRRPGHRPARSRTRRPPRPSRPRRRRPDNVLDRGPGHRRSHRAQHVIRTGHQQQVFDRSRSGSAEVRSNSTHRHVPALKRRLRASRHPTARPALTAPRTANRPHRPRLPTTPRSSTPLRDRPAIPPPPAPTPSASA